MKRNRIVSIGFLSKSIKVNSSSKEKTREYMELRVSIARDTPIPLEQTISLLAEIVKLLRSEQRQVESIRKRSLSQSVQVLLVDQHSLQWISHSLHSF